MYRNMVASKTSKQVYTVAFDLKQAFASVLIITTINTEIFVSLLRAINIVNHNQEPNFLILSF